MMSQSKLILMLVGPCPCQEVVRDCIGVLENQMSTEPREGMLTRLSGGTAQGSMMEW